MHSFMPASPVGPGRGVEGLGFTRCWIWGSRWAEVQSRDYSPRQDSSSAASRQSGCPSHSRARGRQRPSAQVIASEGHRQPCSSVPSPQLSCPSQSRARETQCPERQDIWPCSQPGVAQPGIDTGVREHPSCPLPAQVIALGKGNGNSRSHSWDTASRRQRHLPSSSEPSPQSS